MSAERLHFEPGRMGYEWKLATEHLVRYAFAAPLCRGRRVLDVACGEGYGSYTLASAGATAVVGVDVAADAVAVADARFAAPNLRHLVGDATDLASVLAGEAPFDVVVSYETIEHVPDVDRFLEGIRAVLAPDGIVILGAPNEPDPTGHASTNPFHRRRFTLDEFRTATEHHLGAARRWYLGTPLQGMVLAEAGTPLLLNDRSDLMLMAEAHPRGHAWLLPATREQQVGAADCAFFVGVWGADSDPTVAGCPQSLHGMLEPWKALEWLKSENARLLREREAPAGVVQPATADTRARQYADAVADLRRAALLDKDRLEAAEASLAQARTALDAAETARYADSARAHQAEEQRLAIAEVAARRERQLLAEVTRLGARAERSAHAEAAMRAEIDRLRTAHDQATRADADRARLEGAVRTLTTRLQAVEASRGWRLLQAYGRLLEHPVAGWPLRVARRVLGRS